MPVQGKSICTYPGCNTLVLKGRCEQHPYPTVNKQRSKSYRQRYGSRWSKVRARALRESPRCQYRYKCDGALATEVDHITSIEHGGSYEADNLATCCKPCHSYKTATVDVRREHGKFQSH